MLEHALAAGVANVDTAFNYQRFDGHRLLARVAGSLLGEFAVSTKVGFFACGNNVDHSLRPMWLRDAVEQSVEDLGIKPAVMFLHSPERSLRGVPRQHGHELLSEACLVLAEAVANGMCDAWGIASWEPAPILNALAGRSGCATPDVVMVRAGLTLSADELRDAEQLCRMFGANTRRWGMSPFAGRTSDPVWSTTDLSAFLAPEQPHTTAQAAFRLAYELPEVETVAVGTADLDHLRQLAQAPSLRIADGAIERYRELIEVTEVTKAGRG